MLKTIRKQQTVQRSKKSTAKLTNDDVWDKVCGMWKQKKVSPLVFQRQLRVDRA